MHPEPKSSHRRQEEEGEGESRRRWRWTGSVPHHHFLCTRCGAIEDLPLDAVRGHEALALVHAGERVTESIAVSVRGLCAACATGPGRVSSTR